MSISFSVPSNIDAHLSPLKIFQPTYKSDEKNDLIKRVQSLTSDVPQLFSPLLLTTVCQPNFKVTVYDAALLQDLKNAALFFINHPQDIALETTKEFSWLEIASKLDLLIREKAAFPLLALPHDLLFQIISYLPLPDMSKLIQASSIKTNSAKLKSQRMHYTNIIRDVIGLHPNLIIEAAPTNFFLQACACQKLSKQWLESNSLALSNLFSSLHHPQNRITRHYYLIQMRDTKIFQAFLNSGCSKDDTLLLDILPSSYQFKISTAYWSVPPLLQPSSYRLEDWKKLIESYSHIKTLIIKTKIHDDLTIQQRKELLLKVIGQLQNVKRLELSIQNLAQTLPFYFPSQLKFYQEFIHCFSALRTLVLMDREVKTSSLASVNESNQITNFQHFNLLNEAERRLTVLASNIQKLLHSDLKIKRLYLDVNCLSTTPVKELEDHCHQRNQLYSVFYLNHLLPTIDQGLKLKNISKIHLMIPKPLFIHEFENILRSVNSKFHLLPGHKEMRVLDDKLVFVFQKTTAV